MANGTDSAELQICYSADAQDMLLERPCLVENETEAANRWRKRNIDLIDLHRRRERRMVARLCRCSEHKFRFFFFSSLSCSLLRIIHVLRSVIQSCIHEISWSNSEIRSDL